MKMTVNAEWGKCPICGSDMDKEGSDVQGDNFVVWWACYGCETNIDYFAPNDQREWEEYAAHEITMFMNEFNS